MAPLAPSVDELAQLLRDLFDVYNDCDSCADPDLAKRVSRTLRRLPPIDTAPEPTLVYAVHCEEYEDTRTRAVLTSKELADRHAAELEDAGACDYDVTEFPLLDQAPQRAKTFFRSTMVNRDSGEIMQRCGHESDMWDYECPFETVDVIDDPSGWTTIRVTAHSAARADELLTAEIAAKTPAPYEALPRWSGPALTGCYDAPFGRVHVKSRCECPGRRR